MPSLVFAAIALPAPSSTVPSLLGQGPTRPFVFHRVHLTHEKYTSFPHKRAGLEDAPELLLSLLPYVFNLPAPS